MSIICKGNKPKFETASVDIKAYKVLVPNTTKYNVRWMTPYARTPIGKDVLDGSKVFNATGRAKFTPCGCRDCCFSEGYIHTYAREQDAQIVARIICGKVFPVIIPKGTRYVCGMNKVFSDPLHRLTFASKSIVFDNGSGTLF